MLCYGLDQVAILDISFAPCSYSQCTSVISHDFPSLTDLLASSTPNLTRCQSHSTSNTPSHCAGTVPQNSLLTYKVPTRITLSSHGVSSRNNITLPPSPCPPHLLGCSLHPHHLHSILSRNTNTSTPRLPLLWCQNCPRSPLLRLGLLDPLSKRRRNSNFHPHRPGLRCHLNLHLPRASKTEEAISGAGEGAGFRG